MTRDLTHTVVTPADLPDKFDSLFFIGAGGIGMAALERYYMSKGMTVGGYDRTASDLTAALQAEGADIIFDADPTLIPGRFADPRRTLVIITPAIGADNPLPAYFRDRGFVIVKRSQLLGLVTHESKSLCFAGTHGKTTTSSMAAHILQSGPIGCNAFLGGVLRNYGSNMLLSQDSPYSVVEADEYDRSFHHLRPFVAVITATDPDHLDIYGTEEAYLESFRHFTTLVRPGGKIIVHTGLKLKPTPAEGVEVKTYGRDSGDWHAANIRRGEGRIIFDLVTPDRTVSDIELGVPVEINIDNAVAALAALDSVGLLDEDVAREAMRTFQGAKRRFEFHLRDTLNSRYVIDDYAHHPDELKASVKSVRALFPNHRLTVAFQPHLYSRTRDFAPQFAEALSLADEVLLLDIYPARELPIPGVTSQIIFDSITCPSKRMVKKEELADVLHKEGFDVLLTVGAGDICNTLPQIIAPYANAVHTDA